MYLVIASLLLGISSLALSVSGVLSLALSVPGVIISVVALKKFSQVTPVFIHEKKSRDFEKVNFNPNATKSKLAVLGLLANIFAVVIALTTYLVLF